MIGHQVALLKREFWEHRAIWAAPAAIGAVIGLLALTGQVTMSAFGEAVDLAILGAQNIDAAHRKVFFMGLFGVITTIFALVGWIVIVFYALDALYAERKDKSILFWRSLPITDAETVISKLLTAMLVIPLVTVAFLFVTEIIVLILGSVWVMAEGGNAGHLVWSSAPIADMWLSSIIVAIAMPLWLSPFVGWFLFVSAFAKRSPLAIAFLPIFVVPMLERLIVGTSLFRDAIFVRTFQPPLANPEDLAWMDADHLPEGLTEDMISVLANLDIGGFLLSPSLWVGLVVCGLFTAAAIYVRRYRDESY